MWHGWCFIHKWINSVLALIWAISWNICPLFLQNGRKKHHHWQCTWKSFPDWENLLCSRVTNVCVCVCECVCVCVCYLAGHLAVLMSTHSSWTHSVSPASHTHTHTILEDKNMRYLAFNAFVTLTLNGIKDCQKHFKTISCQWIYICNVTA